MISPRNKYFISTIFIFLLSWNACTNGDIRLTMAEIDGVFIKAWQSLKNGETKEALVDLYGLEYEWKILKETEFELYEEAENPPAIQKIDRLLQTAKEAAKGGNSAEAFVALDRIRLKLIQFRKLHHIDYYLDNIWLFHNNYVVFNEVANDDVLCWLTWEEVAKEANILNQLWKPILRNNPPQEVFQLSKNADLNFQRSRKALNEELKHLTILIECADRENMALSSQKIGRHLEGIIEVFAYEDTAEISLLLE